jgi:putative membrane protein
MRWAVLALGVVLAAKVVPGIRCDDVGALIAVVLLLSFFNAILKPLLVLFTLPFILLTLGLGVIVINALLFLFVGRLVDGFHVAGFWPAVGGALIVSLTNIGLSGLTKRPPGPPSKPPPAKRGDVIDI